MKRPGTDINDKKTYSAAKGVATKRNNAFKKMVKTKLPLFAEEMFSDFVPDTPEQVVERRIVAQENFREWWNDFQKDEQKKIRAIRQECRDLCADDEEFARLRREQMKAFYGRSKRNRWYVLLDRLKRRREPLSELADMCLAWLEQETEPVSHWDLWLKRGDGRDWREIAAALRELEGKELIIICPLKKTILHDGTKRIGGSYKLPPK